jgi:hypothetical protein
MSDVAISQPWENRADLYQRMSAQAFAALQQAAIDAIDTVMIAELLIEAIEDMKGIDPDQSHRLIGMIHRLPAVRAQREAENHQNKQREQG